IKPLSADTDKPDLNPVVCADYPLHGFRSSGHDACRGNSRGSHRGVANKFTARCFAVFRSHSTIRSFALKREEETKAVHREETFENCLKSDYKVNHSGWRTMRVWFITASLHLCATTVAWYPSSAPMSGFLPVLTEVTKVSTDW